MKRFAGFKAEKTTGKRGLFFRVESIKWISQTAAEVA